jgi:hypothetical protein
MTTTPNGGGGYRNPPKHSQFKKGISGNPSGRPKGACDIEEIFERVLTKRVQLSTTDRRKYGSLLEAITLRTAGLALKGDVTAIRLILQMAQIVAASAVANEERPQTLVVLNGPDALV